MTKYAGKIRSAQQKIELKGQVVTYQPVTPIRATDASIPWKVGVTSNPQVPSVRVSMVFLDAKARGSSTQGMASEFADKMDIPAGNKLGLLAGGVGVVPVIGDTIDRGNDYPIYSVSKFKTLDVDGTPILYTLELEV